MWGSGSRVWVWLETGHVSKMWIFVLGLGGSGFRASLG